MIPYGICLSLSDLFHLVWSSLGLAMLLQMALFHSFWWLSNMEYIYWGSYSLRPWRKWIYGTWKSNHLCQDFPLLTTSEVYVSGVLCEWQGMGWRTQWMWKITDQPGIMLSSVPLLWGSFLFLQGLSCIRTRSPLSSGLHRIQEQSSEGPVYLHLVYPFVREKKFFNCCQCHLYFLF